MRNRLLMTGIWPDETCFLIDKLVYWVLFNILVHFEFLSADRISIQSSLEYRKLSEFTNKPISFLNKWWLMGYVSHLCFSPLTDDVPTFYSCITWWHSRGTDVFKWIYRERWCEAHGFSLFSCHFTERKIICRTARGSKPRNRPFQSLCVVKQHVPDYTITHAYSLLCKLLGLLGGFLISLSITQFLLTPTSFPSSFIVFRTSNP